MKLVAREAETDALREWLQERPARITSIVGEIELLRAARRAAAAVKDATVVGRASAVVSTLALVGLSEAIADRAAAVDPAALRSLDAVHLATALLAGPLEAFVAYDDRLAQAAREAGLSVLQPGREG